MMKVSFHNRSDVMNNKNLKITKCVGEGQAECKRCAEIKGFNRNWVSMMYKIDGYDGCYCSDCVETMERRNDNEQYPYWR